jgi:sensor histidine kinase YesM
VRSLYAETLAALLAPRRLVPIALIAIPLLWAQYWFSGESAAAAAVGAAAVLGFLATGPFAWRALAATSEPRSVARTALGLLLFSVVVSLPPLAMAGLMDWGWSRVSFLTLGVNVAVLCGLSWVGGWGLGRDIELEGGLQRATERADALALEAERAQLLAVRAHLDPHFLFNTLNAIAEWCREDGEVAERAVLQLSALLREVLSAIEDERWPLDRELRLVRDVWSLHRLRDPSWFDVSWDVPQPIPAVGVPPMILLPLVENAVKHGPARGHRGTLDLTLHVGPHELRIEVTNPGPYAGPREGGRGVQLVARRLALAYGDRARLDLQGHDGGTRATLTVPVTAEGP